MSDKASHEEVYNILLQFSFIGEFLAFKYAIDYNYSSVINFDENLFVKAGIGAIQGIKKCFSEIGNYTLRTVLNTPLIFQIPIAIWLLI
jgi:hypothetical protein